MWQILDKSTILEASREMLDCFLGLYRKRVEPIRNWGCLDGTSHSLDTGCIIKQYADISARRYLAIDLSDRHIKYGFKKCKHLSQLFLIADFLHHLSDNQCAPVLTKATYIAKKYVVVFNHPDEPHFAERMAIESKEGTVKWNLRSH